MKVAIDLIPMRDGNIMSYTRFVRLVGLGCNRPNPYEGWKPAQNALRKFINNRVVLQST